MKYECCFGCILTTGEEIHFNKKCSYIIADEIDGFVSFYAKNSDTGNKILMQMIPKTQIKQIINYSATESIEVDLTERKSSFFFTRPSK